MDKIFCGSGKKKEFPNGGSITTVSLDLDTLINNFDEYGFTANQSGKRIIKIKVSTKRDGVDTYGNTHNVEIDTWKPDNSQNNNQGGNNSFQPSGNNQQFQSQGFNAGQDQNNKPSYQNYPSGNQGGSGNFEDDIPF